MASLSHPERSPEPHAIPRRMRIAADGLEAEQQALVGHGATIVGYRFNTDGSMTLILERRRHLR